MGLVIVRNIIVHVVIFSVFFSKFFHTPPFTPSLAIIHGTRISDPPRHSLGTGRGCQVGPTSPQVVAVPGLGAQSLREPNDASSQLLSLHARLLRTAISANLRSYPARPSSDDDESSTAASVLLPSAGRTNATVAVRIPCFHASSEHTSNGVLSILWS